MAALRGLIAFFSTGFPLRKVQAYAALRRPHVFNDLEKQEWLFDRRRVYTILKSIDVPTPKFVFYDATDPSTTFVDSDEWLEVNGVRIGKPLVEKPVSGEDHNIYIYYPRSQGGGSKRLFRKVGDRSGQFYADVHTPRVGDGQSYLYEELLQTEGTDVKVYAVGTDYAHAEARKSPVVDGKVNRNARGKESRYPVILSTAEKEIARKVVRAFGQTMCGFDILRSSGNSYVCDVNGWSSVKDSPKFWDDAANLLRQNCLLALAPGYYSACQALLSARSQAQASHRGRSLRMSRGSYEWRPASTSALPSSTSALLNAGSRPSMQQQQQQQPKAGKMPTKRSSSYGGVGSILGDEPSLVLGEAGRSNSCGDDTVALLQLSEPDDDVEGARGLDVEARSPSTGPRVGESGEEAGDLLCVVAFIRHGDRTPKQKLKFTTSESSLLEMITENGAKPTDERKIKTTIQMERLLQRVEEIVQRLQAERQKAGGGEDEGEHVDSPSPSLWRCAPS